MVIAISNGHFETAQALEGLGLGFDSVRPPLVMAQRPSSRDVEPASQARHARSVAATEQPR